MSLGAAGETGILPLLRVSCWSRLRPYTVTSNGLCHMAFLNKEEVFKLAEEWPQWLQALCDSSVHKMNILSNQQALSPQSSPKYNPHRAVDGPVPCGMHGTTKRPECLRLVRVAWICSALEIRPRSSRRPRSLSKPKEEGKSSVIIMSNYCEPNLLGDSESGIGDGIPDTVAEEAMEVRAQTTAAAFACWRASADSPPLRAAGVTCRWSTCGLHACVADGCRC